MPKVSIIFMVIGVKMAVKQEKISLVVIADVKGKRFIFCSGGNRVSTRCNVACKQKQTLFKHWR